VAAQPAPLLLATIGSADDADATARRTLEFRDDVRNRDVSAAEFLADRSLEELVQVVNDLFLLQLLYKDETGNERLIGVGAGILHNDDGVAAVQSAAQLIDPDFRGRRLQRLILNLLHCRIWSLYGFAGLYAYAIVAAANVGSTMNLVSTYYRFEAPRADVIEDLQYDAAKFSPDQETYRYFMGLHWPSARKAPRLVLDALTNGIPDPNGGPALTFEIDPAAQLISVDTIRALAREGE
jgi:hypothetical protein